MAATINLGGKDRALRYDLNALAVIGDKLGVRIRLAHVGEDLLAHPLPLSAIRTIIWAGCLHSERELEEEVVGGWVDQDNLAEVIEYFFDLFSATSPEVRERMIEKVEDATGVQMKAS